MFIRALLASLVVALAGCAADVLPEPSLLEVPAYDQAFRDYWGGGH